MTLTVALLRHGGIQPHPTGLRHLPHLRLRDGHISPSLHKVLEIGNFYIQTGHTSLISSLGKENHLRLSPADVHCVQLRK